MPAKSLAVLGLGSNLGRRAENLASALRGLSGFCDIVKVSSVYGTKSLLSDGQGDYLNLCVMVRTDFVPLGLLAAVKNLETVLGRSPSGRWQSRLIDIDIIDYDNKTFQSDKLTIPHAEMANRSFVLYPLREIFPDYKHPLSCQNIDDMVKSIHDDLGIKKLGVCVWR